MLFGRSRMSRWIFSVSHSAGRLEPLLDLVGLGQKLATSRPAPAAMLARKPCTLPRSFSIVAASRVSPKPSSDLRERLLRLRDGPARKTLHGFEGPWSRSRSDFAEA